MSRAGAQLCSRISSNRETVACAQAVAGHTQDEGAVQVCGRISSNRETVRCATAIADKRYDAAGLAICNRISSNSGIVECLARTGQRPPPPAAAPRATQSSGNHAVRIVNDTPNVTITRVYARPTGASRWPGSSFRGQLTTGRQTTIQVGAGRWDICVESAEGYHTWVQNFDPNGRDPHLVIRGALNDGRVWGASECTVH